MRACVCVAEQLGEVGKVTVAVGVRVSRGLCAYVVEQFGEWGGWQGHRRCGCAHVKGLCACVYQCMCVCIAEQLGQLGGWQSHIHIAVGVHVYMYIGSMEVG